MYIYICTNLFVLLADTITETVVFQVHEKVVSVPGDVDRRSRLRLEETLHNAGFGNRNRDTMREVKFFFPGKFIESFFFFLSFLFL